MENPPYPYIEPSIDGIDSEEKYLRDKFEAQFNNFETISFGNSTFEALDLIPENITDEPPVILVPGFGKSPRSYQEALFELYKTGRRVLSLTAPTQDADGVANDSLPIAQVERAQAILGLLEAKKIDRVDVVAHSEGGMNAAIAASRTSERFRHFVFVALPGVTDTQSYFEIAKRGLQNHLYTKQEKKNVDEETKDRYTQSEVDIKNWIKERGVIKGTLESMNPGRVDISDLVRNLHQDGHGISIISGVEDRMLPMDEYQRDITGKSRSASELGVDGFYSVVKGHAELEVNADMAMLAVHALDALSTKYASKTDD